MSPMYLKHPFSFRFPETRDFQLGCIAVTELPNCRMDDVPCCRRYPRFGGRLLPCASEPNVVVPRSRGA